MPPASAATCQKVEGVIGYQFSNRNLLCEALLADPNGRVYFGSRYMVEADKQIAMVGHAVMGLVVFERAYEGNKLHGTLRTLLFGSVCQLLVCHPVDILPLFGRLCCTAL